MEEKPCPKEKMNRNQSNWQHSFVYEPTNFSADFPSCFKILLNNKTVNKK